MPQQLSEPFYPGIPQAFVAAEPFVGALERPRVDPHVVDAAPNGSLHEAGALESLYVLRRRCE